MRKLKAGGVSKNEDSLINHWVENHSSTGSIPTGILPPIHRLDVSAKKILCPCVQNSSLLQATLPLNLMSPRMQASMTSPKPVCIARRENRITHRGCPPISRCFGNLAVFGRSSVQSSRMTTFHRGFQSQALRHLAFPCFHQSDNAPAL